MIKLEDQSVKSQASPLSSRAIIGKGDALKTDESNEEEFFLDELSSNDNQREGSIVDEITSQRQRVRFNAIDEKTSPKLSVFGRQKTTILGRQTQKLAGFFENTSYTIPNGMSQVEFEDDDPFYEIYNCHKVSFIESKLLDPLDHFEKCEFAKEDMNDYLRQQMDVHEEPPVENKYLNSVKNRIRRTMQPLFDD